MAEKADGPPEKRHGQRAPVPAYSRAPLCNPSAHRLGLRVIVQDFVAHLAPPARLLVSSEGQSCVENVVAIDPHGAGFEVLSGTVSLSDVVRPNTGCEAVYVVVGANEYFLLVGERHGRVNRPE